MNEIVLKNCRLIPDLVEGFDRPDADVVISGQTIQAILPVGSPIPKTADVIDLEGKTLLPGFMDLHTHLYFKSEDIPTLAATSAVDSVFDCIQSAQKKLSYGYTTLRDCGSAFNAAIATRNAVNAGILRGPRILASGRCITPTTTGNEAFGPLYCEIDDPAQARKIVRKEMSYGADFIKYMATGSVLNPGGIPGDVITTREELQALAEAAEELHTYVGAHCHGTEAIKLCAECGVRTIEHATYLDQECIDIIHARGDRSALIPTFAITYELRDGLVGGITPRVKAMVSDVIDSMLANSAKAYAQGVPMGWGSDIDLEGFMIDPFLEFKARRDMGMTNLQMLRQITIESAKIVGLDSVCGTIKVGKDADLIVLAGKPDQNFSDLTQKPAFVFAKGVRF